MALDNDPGCIRVTPPRKSYNPFVSDDDTLDSPGLKSENVYTKENGIGFDLKAFEESADALTFHVDNGDFLWEEALLCQPAVNASVNGHTSLFEKDGQLYTDKNVTECDLPELVDCSKESMYQSVKDIGVDEGVPTQNKIWVQSNEGESKDTSSFLTLSSKSNDAMNIEKDSDELDALEVPKSKLCSDHQKDPSVDVLNQEVVSGQYLVHEFGNGDSLKITELKLDVEDEASFPAGWAATAVQTASGGLVDYAADSHPAAETDPNRNASKGVEPDFLGRRGDDDHDDTVEKKGNNLSLDKAENIAVQELTRGETPSKLSTEHGEVKVKPDENPNKEDTLPESTKQLAAQESAYNNMPDSGSITLDFSSSTNSNPGKKEDEPQNVEEGTSSNSVVSSQEPRIHGETSLYAGVLVPQPSSMTFSGPVAYSGSISLRSESSAGSTRSFAFPILQTEWNSSPVRMAKADQRHFRKHRGWVQAIICCRF